MYMTGYLIHKPLILPPLAKRLTYTFLIVLLLYSLYHGVVTWVQRTPEYIDATFSNRIADNRQLPVFLGECVGPTRILSTSVVHETPSSLLVQIEYCITENDGALATQLRLAEYDSQDWFFTPGSTTHGHGTTYARLGRQPSKDVETISTYRAQLYRNGAGTEVTTSPLLYTKEWSNKPPPFTIARLFMKLGIGTEKPK